MTNSTIAFILVLSSYAVADHPCQTKKDTKMAAHQAVHQCIDHYGQAAMRNEPLPSDECSGKLSEFITAVKDFKACISENKLK